MFRVLVLPVAKTDGTSTGMKESCVAPWLLVAKAKRISALQYSSALARVFVSVVSGASAEDIGSSSNGHGLSDGGCG